eukprot:2641429-Alexandrium_andersonii.AAC.1
MDQASSPGAYAENSRRICDYSGGRGVPAFSGEPLGRAAGSTEGGGLSAGPGGCRCVCQPPYANQRAFPPILTFAPWW